MRHHIARDGRHHIPALVLRLERDAGADGRSNIFHANNKFARTHTPPHTPRTKHFDPKLCTTTTEWSTTISPVRGHTVQPPRAFRKSTAIGLALKAPFPIVANGWYLLHSCPGGEDDYAHHLTISSPARSPFPGAGDQKVRETSQFSPKNNEAGHTREKATGVGRGRIQVSRENLNSKQVQIEHERDRGGEHRLRARTITEPSSFRVGCSAGPVHGARLMKQ